MGGVWVCESVGVWESVSPIHPYAHTYFGRFIINTFHLPVCTTSPL